MNDQADIQAKIKHSLESLEPLREELRLKISLAKADIRSEWDQLERRLELAREQFQRMQLHSESTLSKLEDNLHALSAELKRGYEAIRRSLQA